MNPLKTIAKATLSQEYKQRLVEVYQTNVRPLMYVGNQLTCPCCDTSFRKFLPSGHSPRENALCPKCFSLERHRLLWLYLQNETNFFSDKLKLLHFAPEPCFQKQFQEMPNLEYITTDLSVPGVTIHMDIMDIPFKNNYFDVILCNHVLEHVPDDRKAMSELYRVLKPNGWAILQVPLDIEREETFEDPSIVSPEERARFFGQHDHVRMYGLDYKNRLEEAGFKVKVDDYVKKLGSEVIDKYGLQASEDIYFCHK